MASPARKCVKQGEDFYLPGSSDVARAKAICNGMDGKVIEEDGEQVAIHGYTCPFRDQCLKYAIDHHESYGVWGGTSERDRRKLHRARKALQAGHVYSFEDVIFHGRLLVKRRGD